MVLRSRTSSKIPLSHEQIKRSEGLEYLRGPEVVESLGRKRYTLLVCDPFSRYTWMYFMRHKSDAVELFQQFLVGVETMSLIKR